MRIHSLSFSDGVSAANFIVALRATLTDDGVPATHAGSPAQAWIDAPLRARGNLMCCVYLTEASLAAAGQAGLDVSKSESVDDPTFPEGRILVLDIVPAGRSAG
jgi:hypothetical protein